MRTETAPANPIEAVTHPNPYPYYSWLAQHQPFYRDETIGVWVAASAQAVEAALSHPLAQVRPPAEPIPRHLPGSAAGDIFAKLIRMNDGPIHQTLKPAISKTLSVCDPTHLAQTGSKLAQFLLRQPDFETQPERLTGFMFQFPVYVIAHLLGIPQERLFQIAPKVKEFVQCLTASGNPEQVEAGSIAAAYLLDTFNEYLINEQNGGLGTDSLLFRFVREARSAGCADPALIVANAVGFLSQTYEATAGLIGNTLVALASYPELRTQVRNNPELLDLLVQEVLRYDPPVQNTRRFMLKDAAIGGQNLREGEPVLVALAAANRDPFANPDPERFNLFRTNRRAFSFGFGRHACPGKALAEQIAKAAIEALLQSGLVPEQRDGPILYRPSVNARIPVL